MGEEFFSTCSLLCFRHREGSHGCNWKKENVGVKVIVHWIKLELMGQLLKLHTRAGSDFFFLLFVVVVLGET
jgi:hypothetical protein